MLMSSKMHCAVLMKYKHIFQFINKIQNLRTASHFKRASYPIKQDKVQEITKSLFEGRKGLSKEEWFEARQLLIKNNKYINESNIDSTIISSCKTLEQLPLAKDYIEFLHRSGLEPNVATQGRLLRVYNVIYHARGGECDSLTATEQAEILKICKIIKEKHDILDATTAENIIYGLVTTNEWKKALDLLDMIKVTSSPSIAAYTELIVKAFKVGDMNAGWSLLEEQVEQRKQPKCAVIVSYLKEIKKNSTKFEENLEKLLNFMQKHDLVITDKVVDCLKELAQCLPTALSLNLTKINHKGSCYNCGSSMEKIIIDDKDFEQMRESFLNAVLIRKDVFQKSTPEEVERFKNFVERTKPYDCVIDGLNVAYSQGSHQPPHVMAKLLVTVVKHFANKYKKLLILGRKHMNSWPKESLQYIRRNADIFLTYNLSQDDPFLLYATLRSGPNTDFLSRDFMRPHAFLLGNEQKTIFRRWQQLHQHILVTQTDAGNVITKEPSRFLTCAHKVPEGFWHIPYMQQYMTNYTETFEPPTNWLCLKISKGN